MLTLCLSWHSPGMPSSLSPRFERWGISKPRKVSDFPNLEKLTVNQSYFSGRCKTHLEVKFSVLQIVRSSAGICTNLKEGVWSVVFNQEWFCTLRGIWQCWDIWGCHICGVLLATTSRTGDIFCFYELKG